MNFLYSPHLLLSIVLLNGIIFSGDNQLGTIDTFILKQEIKDQNKRVYKYCNKPNTWPDKEPILLTVNGTLEPIKMPTQIKPLIVIISNAKDIIDKNPHIFCSKMIESKITFISKNQSNKKIHEELDTQVLPIDHCTHIKENNGFLDIISMFFSREIIKHYIKTSPPIKSFPFQSPRRPDPDTIAVRRANVRYYGGSSSADDDRNTVQVHNYNFWNSEGSD